MSGASLRTLVTHGITLKGDELNDMILNCEKPVENRHFNIAAGWYALHNNADPSNLPKAIVGVARFSHSVPVELVPDSLKTKYAEHIHGPVCNVIAEVQRLKDPIPFVKGNLSTWKLTDEDREELQSKLRSDSTTTFTGFDAEFLPPIPAELRALKEKKKRERAASRDGRTEMRKKALSCAMSADLRLDKAELAAK